MSRRRTGTWNDLVQESSSSARAPRHDLYILGAGTECPQRSLAVTITLFSSLRIRQQMRKDIFTWYLGMSFQSSRL
jgi:hypothetical protein